MFCSRQAAGNEVEGTRVISWGDFLHQVIWGPVTVLLLLGCGLYFTVRTGFFQLRCFPRLWRSTVGKRAPGGKPAGGITSFQAAATSLAGCIGTGNIVGVATALAGGGPGALFWMWVSAFFGMILKYAEIVLAVHFRQKGPDGRRTGGPMYYLAAGLRQPWLARVFAVCCVLASFGIGNMTQINSVAQACSAAAGVDGLAVGLAGLVLAALVILGGQKRIAAVSAVTVPVFALFYLGGAVAVLLGHLPELPAALAAVFQGAFTLPAAGGGVLGYLSMQAVRFGFSRGVFSNEAGMGSAAIAHGASGNDHAAEEGLWGIFEVFFDTLFMCTLTGLVILTTGALDTGLDGARLTAAAFSASFGSGLAEWFLTVALGMFAFATLIGWYYYGETCVRYLCRRPAAVRVYQLCYLGCILLGAVLELQLVWDLSDAFNGLMILPNLIGLWGLRRVVLAETQG